MQVRSDMQTLLIVAMLALTASVMIGASFEMAALAKTNHGCAVSTVAKGHGKIVSSVAKAGGNVSSVATGHGKVVSSVAKNGTLTC